MNWHILVFDSIKGKALKLHIAPESLLDLVKVQAKAYGGVLFTEGKLGEDCSVNVGPEPLSGQKKATFTLKGLRINFSNGDLRGAIAELETSSKIIVDDGLCSELKLYGPEHCVVLTPTLRQELLGLVQLRYRNYNPDTEKIWDSIMEGEAKLACKEALTIIDTDKYCFEYNGGEGGHVADWIL